MLRPSYAYRRKPARLSRYRVTGHDKAGAVVFSSTVAAPNEAVARMHAMQELRLSGIVGSRKAQEVESLEAELTWRGSR